MNGPSTAQSHQLNLARIARLESHGRSRGNIQPHAVRSRAVEHQRAIDFEKMTMGSDLDRTVAAIAHSYPTRFAPCVYLNRIGFEKVLARNHAQLVD
jgi:hypothetical protein